jgi:hypothetical protein
VTFGSVPTIGSHTFEIWVKPDGVSSGAFIVQTTSSSPECTEGIIVETDPLGRICYDLNPLGCGNSDFVCTRASYADVWTHVAVTWLPNTARLYVNGQLAATNSSVGTPTTSFLRAGSYVYGAGGDSFFGGELDELRIWSVARTQQQIIDDMFLALDGTEADLRRLWTFDEGSGQTVTDLTSNADEGVLGETSSAEDSDPSFVSSGVCALP